jgi:hypothetical protein
MVHVAHARMPQGLLLSWGGSGQSQQCYWGVAVREEPRDGINKKMLALASTRDDKAIAQCDARVGASGKLGTTLISG